MRSLLGLGLFSPERVNDRKVMRVHTRVHVCYGVSASGSVLGDARACRTASAQRTSRVSAVPLRGAATLSLCTCAAARRPAAALRPERVWGGGRRYACLTLHTQPLRGLWRPCAPSPVPIPPDTSPGTDVAAAAGLGAVRPPQAGGHCHGYHAAVS